MSDDLVKRLRERGGRTPTAAADRIEQLEREKREAALDALAAHGQANDAYEAQLKAEARLDKAVVALRFYAEGRWPDDYPGGVLHDVDGVTHIDYGHKATAVLAEIEGGKDD